MTTKDAIYREMKYALAGSGGGWDGLVEQDHIKLDVRIQPSSSQSDDDYPWVIFRRLVSEEDNQVRYAKERFEVVLVGRISSASKGDDLLEEMREALIDHFAGKTQTWGKFEADGSVDADGGLKMKAVYLETVESAETDIAEKAQVLTFAFTHVRQ